jgi:hypothetical protein|tara:strand:+ start:5030 stop:5455 length:426 start_codon:yes stop_codon:yes gene_type:complete
MLDELFEIKLKRWNDFRSKLEDSIKPFEDVIDYYNTKKRCKLSTDPWNQAIWPTPWELLDHDKYCDFMLTLGTCYTLQLTDRFKDFNFEIHISIDKVNEELLYPLHIESKVLCYNYNGVIQKNELPTTIIPQRIYKMPRLQ